MTKLEEFQLAGWHDPEQRDGRGERGEDVERLTGFDSFTPRTPRPSKTQSVPPE